MSVYVPLGGSHRTPLPGSEPAGPVDLDEIATVTVRLRSRDDIGKLVSKAHDLGHQPLAQRRYLTHQDLANQHGATPDDLDAIEKFALEHNLTVVHRSAAARSLALRGTLHDLLNVFHTEVQMYRHPTGSYRGRRRVGNYGVRGLW